MNHGPFTWLAQGASEYVWDLPSDVTSWRLSFGAASIASNADGVVELRTADGWIPAGTYYFSSNYHFRNAGHHDIPPRDDGFLVAVGNRILGLHGRLYGDMLDASNHSWTVTLNLSFAGSPTLCTGAGSVQATKEIDAIRFRTLDGAPCDNGRIALHYVTRDGA